MRIRASFIATVTMLIVVLLNMSCKKNRQLTVGGALSFSTDTLKFDTVFTAAGSFTSGILIYNPQNEEITVSSVRLNEGAASYFHLNVNGYAGNVVTNLKIPAHDSIYVFATVNIDPNNKRTPFVITDSLIATLNGKEFYLPITAYGQNAHYIINALLVGNHVWDTTLPYVIINSAEVGPGSTLTINPGCKIYMHQNSGLIVEGQLFVNGTARDTVIFQGDRLDRSYFSFKGYPGEWGGLYFGSHSNGSRMSYTRLKNCGNSALGGFAAAIWVTPDSVNFNNPSATPQLQMDHCMIENSIGYGILSFQGTVVASNCLVHTTGAEALVITKGGYDSFVNCTFANYGSFAVSHTNYHTVGVLNYFQVSIDSFLYGDLNAILKNCIVYGSLDSEIICDASDKAAANLRLDHCLLKMGSIRESFIQFTNCLFNQDPKFKDAQNFDYHLQAGSPAIDAGATTTLTDDLDNKMRQGGVDIGCYEYQP